MTASPLHTSLYTGLALVAFAANSVLCRLALGEGTIDAASFTTLRIASGALTLLLISAWKGNARGTQPGGSWASAGYLLGYAIAFSFAYISLDAGTGALILFGAVQITMISAGLALGERPRALEWIGLTCAIVGLVYLVLPGFAETPPLAGSVLMAAAGLAWGLYSLRGQLQTDALATTTGNFVRATPAAAVCSVFALASMNLSTTGALLAVASGALASGLGYVVWYAALRGLTATRAATVQLAVPILAALGGATVLSETISGRLVFAAVLVLGGVGVAVTARKR